MAKTISKPISRCNQMITLVFETVVVPVVVV